MKTIDHSHLRHALMDTWSVLWTCDFADVHFAKPDMPEPLRPALICREKLTEVYKHLAEAIQMATPYENVPSDLVSEIDKTVLRQIRYDPSDKWSGRYSATAAAIDCLNAFAFAARRYGWHADELRRIRDRLSAWDHADCWDNYDCMQSAIAEVNEVMTRWRNRFLLEWRILNRAVEVESCLFTVQPPKSDTDRKPTAATESETRSDSLEVAPLDPIEITDEEHTFLIYAVRLGADRKIVSTDDINRSSQAIGDNRHVRESLKRKGLIKSRKGMPGIMVTPKGMTVYEKQCAH